MGGLSVGGSVGAAVGACVIGLQVRQPSLLLVALRKLLLKNDSA